MKTLIKTASAASLLALAVSGTSAVAAPLSELGFSQHAGFGAPTFFGGSLQFKAGSTVPNADPLAPPGTSLGFAWEGSNDPAESSIAIQSYNNSNSPDSDPADASNQIKLLADLSTPDVDGQWNAGDWWVIDTLTQTNETLTSFGGAIVDPLWQVDALANLRFYDDASRSNLIYADPTTTNQISFNETLNQANCPDAPLGTNCDDIFTVATLSLAPVSFVHAGYIYNINFTLFPGTSTNASGTPVGLSFVQDNGDGTISVYTPENNPGTSSIHVAMSYSAAAVPEPGILGLFSVGMLGLGLAARRGRKMA